jgi:hypothetical protein
MTAPKHPDPNISKVIVLPRSPCLTTIRLQRRHLVVDAGIQHWMRASVPGWRPGNHVEDPPLDAGSSTMRVLAERDDGNHSARNCFGPCGPARDEVA